MSLKFEDEWTGHREADIEIVLKERIKELENIITYICEAELDSRLDFVWQEWADPLKQWVKKHKVNYY
jgi:hypothetical protein